MRHILTSIVLAALLCVCGCQSVVEKEGIKNVEKTNAIILPDYVRLLDEEMKADPTKTANIDDKKKLVESLKRLVQSLKDSAGVK